MRLVQGVQGANRMYLKARSEQCDCKMGTQVAFPCTFYVRLMSVCAFSSRLHGNLFFFFFFGRHKPSSSLEATKFMT